MSSMTQLLVAWMGLLMSAWPLDRVIENFVPRLPPKSLLRATDTVDHGLIGGFSYWMACIICPDMVLNVYILLPSLGFEFANNSDETPKKFLPLNVFFSFCVAFMISSCIDLDHIVKNVLHTMNGPSFAPWERGWLHLSLPPLALTCILYSSGYLFHLVWCVTCGTLCILSVLSHHIRDGVHHGLDFYPVGTTPILPYWFYVILTLILPIVSSHLSLTIIKEIKYEVATLTNEYVI